MNIDWLKALAVAVSAAGLIQYAKGWTKAPTWVWGAAMPVLCVALVFVPPGVLLGMLAVALAQLGYNVLIQPVLRLIGIAPKE